MVFHRAADLFDGGSLGCFHSQSNFGIGSSADVVDSNRVSGHACDFDWIVVVVDFKSQFALAFDEHLAFGRIGAHTFCVGRHCDREATFFDRQEDELSFGLGAGGKFHQIPDDRVLIGEVSPFVRCADKVHSSWQACGDVEVFGNGCSGVFDDGFVGGWPFEMAQFGADDLQLEFGCFDLDRVGRFGHGGIGRSGSNHVRNFTGLKSHKFDLKTQRFARS